MTRDFRIWQKNYIPWTNRVIIWEGDEVGHRPVMLNQVRSYLGGVKDGILIDGTLGMGGHSEALLSETPESVTVAGIDRDASAVGAASERLHRFGNRFVGIHGSYHDYPAWKDRLPAGPVTGFLMDLGMSSVQLEPPGRGFSFRDTQSLDMRYDRDAGIPTAAELVNSLSETDLADILYRYGDEKASRKIARAIVRRREKKLFDNARDLSTVVSGVSRSAGRIDPATRTFQALRIAVNRELDILKSGLETALGLLSGKGRLVVISYHSLEDRIIKTFLLAHSGKCTCPPNLPVCRCDRTPRIRVLTGKPLMPEPDEIRENPRSRSAKMRCAERLFEEGGVQ